jgi:hypothetical protein
MVERSVAYLHPKRIALDDTDLLTNTLKKKNIIMVWKQWQLPLSKKAMSRVEQ